jgi:predicted DNA-binding transcriptional regulator AlpA
MSKRAFAPVVAGLFSFRMPDLLTFRPLVEANRMGRWQKTMSRETSVHLPPALSPERRGCEAAPTDTATEPYINKREVARRMGRTTRTVDNLMRRGLIPYYKLGYSVAFRWSEIQSHLAQTCRVCRRSIANSR